MTLQFGQLTDSMFATLVRSRLATLSLMETAGSPEIFSDLEFDDVSIPDDAFDPALSPGALMAQEQGQAAAEPEEGEAMVVDAPHPSQGNVPAPAAQVLPAVAA